MVIMSVKGKERHKHVVVVGLGNIGSNLISHLAKVPALKRVTLVDHDVYERGNLQSQDIMPGHVGKPKADVQARRLRRTNPDLEVVPVRDRIENVPLALLRSDVILAGLDGRRARQVVNEKAWFLGIPWIDGGVNGEGLLARFNVYVPGPDRACMECAWGDTDYENLEQIYPCMPQSGSPRAPGAPSSLGGLVASFLVSECHKLLAGELHRIAPGRQVLIDLAHHQYYVSTIPFNARCRFAGHQLDPIRELEARSLDATLEQLLLPGTEGENGNNADSLEVLGQRFVTRLTCTRCGLRRSHLRLKAAAGASASAKCPRCKAEMIAAGFDLANRLKASTLSKRSKERSLRSIGVRRGDILRIGDPGRSELRYVEVTSRA
jgi:molybdopterin/thiamine biosynthesis adenylyltransferase